MNKRDSLSPYEVWLINHAIGSQTRITGRYDKDDAIGIAKRQVTGKRSFLEARVITSRSMEIVFTIRGDEA